MLARPHGISAAPHFRELPPPRRPSIATLRISARGDPARVSDRRGGSHYRLRQKRRGADHGGIDSRHSAIVLWVGPMLDGWPDGELVGSVTVILRSRRKSPPARSTRSSSSMQPRFGAVTRPLQPHGHGFHDSRRLRGARTLRCPGARPSPRPIASAARSPMKRADASSNSPAKTCSRLRSSHGSHSSTPSRRSPQSVARLMPSLIWWRWPATAGIEITPRDWMYFGRDIPLLVNMQPAGKYLRALSSRGCVPPCSANCSVSAK